MRLMDFHGDFSADDLEWNAQARLEAKLLDYCAAKFDREPSRSQLRSHIEGWLARWRKQFDPGR